MTLIADLFDMRRLAIFIATVAHCGYVSVAPGTAGSVVGLVVLALLRWNGSPVVELAAIVVVSALGVWASTIAEQHFGTADPKPVVIDEVTGMLVTFALLPVGWLGVLAGFLLFRVVDIIKPFPADYLERLPGGWGVVADDLAAGLYAHAGLRVLSWLVPEWIA